MSILAGACVAIVGALVLAGWALDLERLKSIYGPITMKTNAAIGLLLCGTALCAHARGWRRLGICCAAVAACTGALTLLQHVAGWDLGIDQLLFTEPAGAAATASPNRMGPNASMSLVLAGLGLLLVFRGTPRAITAAQQLSVVAILLAMLPLAGYIYGAVQLYGIARYTGIALHTAIALVVLHGGILLARTDHGPVTAFTGDGPAGTLLRRLVAPVIVIPLAIGYLVIQGRRLELFDRGLSIAFFAVAVVVVLGTIVWRTATAISRSDAERRRAEEDRDRLLVRERHARDDAERANRLKDQFIAVLSHELRTPLNVMLGWIRILETNSAADHRGQAAGVVARNARLLARLVEDLLDISRVSAGQFELSRQPMLFNAVVQASLDALRPTAAAKNVDLAVDLDPALGAIDGDPQRVQQIVWNLLSNGIKFTPAGGRVEVRTSRGRGAATLTVADTGIGFDRDFAAALFQPFRQADSSVRREYGGLGLGLSISRHIAERHGGSLVGSSPGRGCGATFTLTLPDATSAVGDADPTPADRVAPPSSMAV